MSVAGTYETTVKSPMGDQKGTLTVNPGADGTSFTGSMAGGMGSMDIADGSVDGDRWRHHQLEDEHDGADADDADLHRHHRRRQPDWKGQRRRIW